MTDCPTIGTLSEFVEGKLSPDSRHGIVAHLNACKTCYGAVSASLSIREELASQSRTRVRKYLAYGVPAGLAAAAALLLAVRVWQPAPEITSPPATEVSRHEVPVKKRQPGKPEKTIHPRSFAGGLAARLSAESRTALLARSADDGSGHRAPFGFSAVVKPEKAAFRIGACLTRLELALDVHDRQTADRQINKLEDLLRPLEPSLGPLPTVSAHKENGKNTGKEPDRYEGYGRAVEALFENRKEAFFVRFGSWVEAAGLAADAGDVSFFDTAGTGNFRTELEGRRVPVGTRNNMSLVESIVSTGNLQADQFMTLSRLLADIKEMF